MKQLILWVVSLVLITSATAYGQTGQLNQQKYWKLRDALREDFVKISPDFGGSIVARALVPNTCFNNIDDSPGNGMFSMGEMHFGDGMIRQGYYLGLLATEYRLLKDSGQDTMGVLNELYYALAAINRVDLNAELEQSEIYGFTQPKILNGFYQREDIPEDFASENWGSTPMRMECVNSPHFKTNNADRVHNPLVNVPIKFEAYGNSYQNTPSLDQLSSLMMGFRLIHKLVDNPFVKPTSNDDGFYIVSETQAIVNRMMTYLNQHNWMMIDVNGWPVNNGGGDAVYSAYPLYKAALIITGNHYDSDWTRRVQNLFISDIACCITGYCAKNDADSTQQRGCTKVVFNPLASSPVELQGGVNYGTGNNQNYQDESRYQEWLANGPLHGDVYFMQDFWTAFNTIAQIDQFQADLIDNGKLEQLPYPWGLKDWEDPDSRSVGSNDGNLRLLTSNVGIAGNLFSPSSINLMTNSTGNKQLDLMQAVLEDNLPVRPKDFFEDYINSMHPEGPYNFTASNGTSNISKSSPNGWGSEDRWTWASDVNGGFTNSRGIFNGIDYMLFYNLYRLVFPADQPLFTPESSEDCFCDNAIVATIPSNLPNPDALPIFEQLKEQIDQKLVYVPNCTEDVFAKYNNVIGSTVKVAPYFPEYSDMYIYTNEFQMNNTLVKFPGGYIDVETPFIVCNNSTLTFEPNTVMKIVQKHVSVNNGSTIDLSGELYVQPGTELRIKAGGNLILRPGSKLILHENCSVIIEPGATLTYYSGATIYTKNDDSGKLIIRGSLNLENNAIFSIDHSFSTSSGLIVFEGKPVINAKPGAEIDLTGKSSNDLIIKVKDNTKVYFSDPDIKNIKLTDCGVDINSNNSFIRFEQPVNTLRAKFTGNNVISGKIYVTDVNLFRQTDFVNTHVGAELNIENNATLRMVSCNFTQTLPYYLNGSGINVHGRGYSLTSCNFNIYAGGNAMVESEGLTLNSSVSSCVFADVNPGNIGQTAIYDVSNVDILVSASTFNTLRNAIQKTTGKLTLRCNTFTNGRDNSVTMRGGLLNMATGTGGGYNTFGPMTGTLSTRCHIYLEKALIDMTLGSNYLRDVPVAGGLVRGTLQTTCSSALNCNLDFSGNQWNPIFALTPASTRFSIKSANNINVTVNTLLPMQKASCGSLDVINGFVSVLGSTVNAVLNQIPTYYSQTAGQNLRLDQGIQEAINRMTALNDGTGNDLQAIAYLDEIFRSNISYGQGSALTQKLLLQAKSHMKLALESAMGQGLITASQNLYNFDGTTEDFVNSTNRVTSSAVTENNYFRQFYNELDKAQVLRAIGQPQKSLELLTELESCGLDFMEQSIVNREKKYAMKEIRIAQVGMAFLDTVYVPDTSAFITPVHYAGDYHFGSIIQSLSNINYQNCMGSQNIMVETENKLEVFPNPASEELTIRFPDEPMEGDATIQIYQYDGRLLSTTILNKKQQLEWTTDVSAWTPGTYQYVYIRPDGMKYSGVLVVVR